MGGVTNQGVCLPLFEEHIKDQLTFMVSDLRSIIVKEACSLLNMIANKMGSLFEDYSVIYIPLLLKQSVVKIRIISESAHVCIRTLLAKTQITNIRSIVEGCNSPKNPIMRRNCTSYLTLILEKYPTSKLDKMMDNLSSLLRTLLQDASAEVRAEARGAFALFSKYWPDAADRIMNEIPVEFRKYLTPQNTPQPAPKASRSQIPRNGNFSKNLSISSEVMLPSSPSSTSVSSLASSSSEYSVSSLDETETIVLPSDEKRPPVVSVSARNTTLEVRSMPTPSPATPEKHTTGVTPKSKAAKPASPSPSTSQRPKKLSTIIKKTSGSSSSSPQSAPSAWEGSNSENSRRSPSLRNNPVAVGDSVELFDHIKKGTNGTNVRMIADESIDGNWISK
eukprot:TRINITY_DN10619_c0_g1_i2.p1 TRINITY_DN10619_c0_g1~~TRINITY_DN10619_c0_g1_i2.p1  ORF type:complete len:448 (+),score=90.33 TRINITY_DN10619_c0_g1_i2:171-1346(+)